MERISRMLDHLDYRGSMIYDEYPDRLALFRLAESIQEQIRREEEQEKGDSVKPDQEPVFTKTESGADDRDRKTLIQILLYYEIFRRRRKSAKCRLCIRIKMITMGMADESRGRRRSGKSGRLCGTAAPSFVIGTIGRKETADGGIARSHTGKPYRRAVSDDGGRPAEKGRGRAAQGKAGHASGQTSLPAGKLPGKSGFSQKLTEEEGGGGCP